MLYFAAIDVLQKSRSRYYGEILPTIVTVQKKLLAMKGKVRHGSVILDSCLSGLQKRFCGLLKMENEQAVIALCSHPYFKNAVGLKRICESFTFPKLALVSCRSLWTGP